ncbi:MAG: hypothetical protein ACTSW1_15645 [Candidatus Hodarchaeales archaeon]
MSFNIRLKKIIDHANTNPTRFGALLGYNNSENIRKLLNTQNANPGLRILNDIISRFPEINAHWLITGEGNMILDHEDKLNDENTREGKEPDSQLIKAWKECGALELEVKLLKEKVANLETEGGCTPKEEGRKARAG